jgi:hypothetical protein
MGKEFYIHKTNLGYKMKPIIYSVGTDDGINLRIWQPEDEEVFVMFISIGIGRKGKKGSDDFSIRIATPKGLMNLESDDGIIATRSLLIMERYNFQSLWRWLEKTVASCEGSTWPECVEKLRYYFDWEYHDYQV